MKIYTARSEISVNVTAGGIRRHVKFQPVSSGGSVLSTDDPALQAALEAHPRFGSLFGLDAETVDTPAPRKKSKP